jgi:hypothetical protein
MNKLIIGKQGSGKTTFIKKNLILTLGTNFLVIDFLNEYKEIKEQNKVVAIEVEINKFKNIILSSLKIGDKDTVFIFDNVNLANAYNKDTRKTLDWLLPEIKDKNTVMVMQSIHDLNGSGLKDIFDDIIYFPTRDRTDICLDYLNDMQKVGKKVTIF